MSETINKEVIIPRLSTGRAGFDLAQVDISLAERF